MSGLFDITPDLGGAQPRQATVAPPSGADLFNASPDIGGAPQKNALDTPGAMLDTLHQIPLLGGMLPSHEERQKSADIVSNYMLQHQNNPDVYMNARLGAPTAGLKEGLTQIGEGLKQTAMAAGTAVGAVSEDAYNKYSTKVTERRFKEATTPEANFPGYGVGHFAGATAPFVFIPSGTITGQVAGKMIESGVPKLWAWAGANIATASGLGALAGTTQFVDPQNPEVSRPKNALFGGVVGAVLAAAPYTYAPTRTYIVSKYNDWFGENTPSIPTTGQTDRLQALQSRQIGLEQGGITSPTAGQITNNPEAISLEQKAAALHPIKAVEVRTEQAKELYGNLKSSLDSISAPTTAKDLNIGTINALKKDLTQRVTARNAAYEDGLNSASELTQDQKFIPLKSLKTRIADVVADQEPAVQTSVQSRLLDYANSRADRGRVSVDTYANMLRTANKYAGVGANKDLWRRVKKELDAHAEDVATAGNVFQNQRQALGILKDTRDQYHIDQTEIDNIFKTAVGGSRLGKLLTARGNSEEKLVQGIYNAPDDKFKTIMDIVDTHSPQTGMQLRRSFIENALTKAQQAAKTADTAETTFMFDIPTFVKNAPSPEKMKILSEGKTNMDTIVKTLNAANYIQKNFSRGGLSSAGEASDVAGLGAGSVGGIVSGGGVGQELTFLGRYVAKYGPPGSYAKWVWDPEARRSIMNLKNYLENPQIGKQKAASGLTYLWTLMDLDMENPPETTKDTMTIPPTPAGR